MTISYLYLQILSGIIVSKIKLSREKGFSFHYQLFTCICPTIICLIYYLPNYYMPIIKCPNIIFTILFASQLNGMEPSYF